jgi:hypothetical protein
MRSSRLPTAFGARQPDLRVELQEGRFGGGCLRRLPLAELVFLLVGQVQLLGLRLHTLGGDEVVDRPAQDFDLVAGGDGHAHPVAERPWFLAALPQ